VIDDLAALALSAEDRALLEGGKLAEVLTAEEHYGGQQAALAAHPELADAAEALQRARAAAAARELGLELRGDGRALPDWLVAELSRTFRRIVVHPRDRHAG
jgi:hypothetical protein